MSDSKKTDSIETPELNDSQLEGATGGAAVLTISGARVVDSAILNTARLKDLLSRFREPGLLGANRLTPFDRGSLVAIPSSN